MFSQITLPTNLSLFDQGIDLGLVGISLFVIIYLVVFYTSLYKKYDPYSIFDHVFKTLIIAVIISRSLAIVNNLDRYVNDPLSIFLLTDQMFFYPGILLGVITSSMFFSNKMAGKIGYMYLLDLTLRAYVISSVFLLLGFSLNGRISGVTYEGPIALMYQDGIKRFPYGFIQVIYNLISIFILFLLSRSSLKHGIPTAVYIIIFSGIEFILRFFSSEFIPVLLGVIDLYQFIYLVLLVFSILIFLRINQVQNINFTDNSEDIPLERIRISRSEKVSAKDVFSLSYNSIESKNESTLTAGEKLKNWYRGMKRKTQVRKGRGI